MARGSITSSVGRFVGGAFGITGAALAGTAMTATGITLGAPVAIGILGIVAAYAGGAAIYRGREEAQRDSKVDGIQRWLEQLVRQHGSLQKALAGLEDESEWPLEVARDRIRAVREVFAGGIEGIEGIEARLAEHGDFARCIRDSMVELEASDEQFRLALSNLIDFAVEQKQISEQQLDMLNGLDAKVDAVLAMQAEHGKALGRIESHQQGAATKEDIARIEAQQKQMLELMKRGQSAEQASDPGTERDLVSAVERLARDAERGGITAQRILEHQNPGDVADYLSARRRRLEEAKAQINQRIDEESIELDREIAAVAFTTGRIDDAKAALERILAVLPNDLDAINRMGTVHQLRGELSEAEAMFRRVLELAGNDQLSQAVAYGNLGILMFTRNDLDRAEEMYRKSLDINERLDLQEGMACGYTGIGNVMLMRGNFDDAEAMYHRSLEIEKELGRQEGMASDYGNLGNLMYKRGDLDRAEEMYRRALEIQERLELQEGMANQYANLGLVMEQRDDVAGARSMWEKARGLYERIGMKQMVERMDKWLDGLGGEGTSE